MNDTLGEHGEHVDPNTISVSGFLVPRCFLNGTELLLNYRTSYIQIQRT